MKQAASKTIVTPPESRDDVRTEAQKLLRRAKVVDVFPTPIDTLVKIAGVQELANVEQARQSFLRSVASDMRGALESAWQKLRGFADVRFKSNYAAVGQNEARRRWVRLHELGHQQLPWQQLALYEDDAISLSESCEEAFDREANAYASELLFQGDRFPAVPRHAGDAWNSIFSLANRYGASRHATGRRFALEAREPLLLVTYFPSRYAYDSEGLPQLTLGRGHSASPRFLARYSEMLIPQYLTAEDSWAKARTTESVESGCDTYDCGDGTTTKFQWEAWWNTHHLLVLLWRSEGVKLLRL